MGNRNSYYQPPGCFWLWFQAGKRLSHIPPPVSSLVFQFSLGQPGMAQSPELCTRTRQSGEWFVPSSVWHRQTAASCPTVPLYTYSVAFPWCLIQDSKIWSSSCNSGGGELSSQRGGYSKHSGPAHWQSLQSLLLVLLGIPANATILIRPHLLWLGTLTINGEPWGVCGGKTAHIPQTSAAVRSPPRSAGKVLQVTRTAPLMLLSLWTPINMAWNLNINEFLQLITANVSHFQNYQTFLPEY